MKHFKTIICEHTKCSKTKEKKSEKDQLALKAQDGDGEGNESIPDKRSKFRRIKENVILNVEKYLENIQNIYYSQNDQQSEIDETGHTQSKFDWQELLYPNDHKEEYIYQMNQEREHE